MPVHRLEPRLQARLTIGAVNDPLEQEADAAADRVMRMADGRAFAADGRRRTMRDLQEAEALRRKEAGPQGAIAEAPASVHEAVRSPGRPLDAATRQDMEERFGRDFSHVRVHSGGAANRSARDVSARAYTVGSHIVFGEQGSPSDRRLLAHELAHVVQQNGHAGLLQRSPLSDAVKAAWTADPKLETLLARLSQSDVQAAQADPDIDAEIMRILGSNPNDLWVAQRIRSGELGKSTGRFGPQPVGMPVPRPVQAFFFRGSTDRRALVIAGVHGSERQGIEVVEMLMDDLSKQPQPPLFNVIAVPTLFPDSKARGDALAAQGAKGMTLKKMQTAREYGPDPKKDIPTNRNFPPPSQDLAAAKAAGGGTAFDAEKTPREILPENQMLMELMERFRPERIISVHGTFNAGMAGVFYDKRSLREDEKPGPWRPSPPRSSPSESEDYGEASLKADREAYEKRVPAIMSQRAAAADKTDRDLSLKAAVAIDAATASIPKRNKRDFSRDKETKEEIKERRGMRAKHPSVAGNVGAGGKLDHAIWGGDTPEGISLGSYAPPRGMSVFTVEPPLNYRSDDPARLEALSAVERKAELKAYVDAIRTILLGSG